MRKLTTTNSSRTCLSCTRIGAPGSRSNIAGIRCEDGQALVEFALVLPVLLVVVFGIAAFGVALNDWNDETHLVNEAARFAAVNSEFGAGEIKFIGGVYEVDEVSVGKATAGSIVLSFKWNGAVYNTGSISYNASASVVATAVQEAKGSSSQTLPAKCASGSGTLATAVKLTFEGACTGPVTEQVVTPTGLTNGTATFKRATAGEYGQPSSFLKSLTAQGDNGEVQNATATICSPTSKLGDYVEVRMKYVYQWFGLSKFFEWEVKKGKHITFPAETPIESKAYMRIEVPPSTPYPTTC